MSPEFSIVGGPSGDPCVRWRAFHEGIWCCFDLGEMHALSTKDCVRISHAFVSHTHMDHFHGFDRWLRVHVPVKRKLYLYGPKDIQLHVQAKLRGYLWNLIAPDQLQFEVKEATSNTLSTYLIRNTTGFALEPLDTKKIDGSQPFELAQIDKKTRVLSIILDHKTDVLGFSVEFGPHLRLKLDVLAGMGLEPGAWIATADDSLRKKIFEEIHQKTLSYITDIGFTEENARRVQALCSGVEHFVCETNFRRGEEQNALDKMHLTTEQAATLAAMSQAKNLHTFHVSQIYKNCIDDVVEEAQILFREKVGFHKA